MFDNLRWSKDRVLLNDLVFRLEPEKTDDWELGDECFRLYKNKHYIDSYAKWLPRAGIQNVLELGIFDGGSLALFHECLAPKKIVSIDQSQRGDSAYFRKYVQSRGLQDRVKTFWGVDQTDSNALRAIVAREFDGPLDLVVDDASHFYGDTKTSFEILFPLVREGGTYVIEDWPWEFVDDDGMRAHFAKEKLTLTDLIADLVGSIYSKAIVNMVITREFVVVERGPLSEGQVDDFRIVPRKVRSTP